MKQWGVVGVLLVGLGLMGSAQARSLPELTTCMRANIPESVRIQGFELTAVDRTEGQRTMRGRLYAVRSQELIRANLKLMSPPDLKDAAYLLRETSDGRDDMFVYLPALNRVRRVVGATRDNPLFGTDFSYNDLRQLHNAFSGDEVELIENGRYDERAAHLLEVVPPREDGNRYSRIRAWVDEESCVALLAEFYEGARMVKRMESPARSLQQAGGNWYAGETRMYDLVAQSHSLLRIVGVESGGAVPERLFNPRMFYLGQ